jgi:hypothetical protein
MKEGGGVGVGAQNGNWKHPSMFREAEVNKQTTINEHFTTAVLSR